MKRTAYLGCSLLMMATLAIPTVARAQSNSLDEGTAYANFYAEQDCKAKAALGEALGPLPSQCDPHLVPRPVRPELGEGHRSREPDAERNEEDVEDERHRHLGAGSVQR